MRVMEYNTLITRAELQKVWKRKLPPHCLVRFQCLGLYSKTLLLGNTAHGHIHDIHESKAKLPASLLLLAAELRC